MQKFNGNNTFNNRIHVDFENKKVDFTPIIGDMNKISNYLASGYTLRNIFIKFVLIIFAGTFIISTLFRGINFEVSAYLLTISLIIYFILPLFFASAFLFSKKLRDNYPKINARLICFDRSFNQNSKSIKKGDLNLELIKDNKLIIKDFENVYLKYELEGECSDYIKDIKIINVFVNNPYYWEIHFIFKKTPKTGKVFVEYL